VVSRLVLGELGDPMMTLTSVAGAWHLLQRCSERALEEATAGRETP
jgi:hypothetical protein